MAYDPFGRLVSVWPRGRAKATYPTTPGTSYQYAMSATVPSVVTTNALGPNCTYITSRTIYDALLRTRQVQRPEAGTGGGRIVTDTFYDSAGRNYMTWGPYPASGATSTTLFVPTGASDNISQWSRTLFDGSGRPVEADTNSKTAQLWHITTAYTGDPTDTTPPADGIASSTRKRCRAARSSSASTTGRFKRVPGTRPGPRRHASAGPPHPRPQRPLRVVS